MVEHLLKVQGIAGSIPHSGLQLIKVVVCNVMSVD